MLKRPQPITMNKASTVLAGFGTHRIVVGVGDMAVSNSTLVTVSTFALGSCIGVAVYDPAVKAGGLLHIMLPKSDLSPEKAKSHPYMFADTGMHGFFKALQGIGVRRKSLHLMIAGGASVMDSKDIFRIGQRNTDAVLQILKDFQIRPLHVETGGFTNRTVHLCISTGSVNIKEPTGTQTFDLS